MPHTVLDLFASSDIGAGLVGGRLSLGTGGSASVTSEDETIRDSQTFAALTAGYSMVDDFRLDSSLTLRYSGATEFNETIEETDEQTLGEGNAFLVGANVRGYSPMVDDLDLGFLADLHFETDTWVDDPDQPDDFIESRENQFALLGGAGPVYYIDETTIAGYGVLGYTRSTSDANVNDDDVLSTFTSQTVLPGLHVAADIEVFEWLYFRSGIQYNFDIESGGGDVDPDDEDATRDSTFSRSQGDGFAWRTGIGVEVDRFTLDGVFQQGFIANGPDFLGGAGGGMFTMVSAAYRF